LESITYSQHWFATVSRLLDDSEAGTGSRDRAGPEIVAIAESTGKNICVIIVMCQILVPDKVCPCLDYVSENF
jgi:hypothetical protein